MENKERLILDYIRKGYDICLPGGSGRNGSNAAFDCLGYRYPNKEFEIIIIPVYRKSFEDYMQEQKDNFKLPFEYPLKIAKREIKEELNIFIDIRQTFQVSEKAVQDDRPGFENSYHRKYLYLSERYDARYMRKTLLRSQPHLGIPFGISFRLFEKYLWEGHRWMIEPLAIYTKYRIEHLPPARQVLSFAKQQTLLCAV